MTDILSGLPLDKSSGLTSPHSSRFLAAFTRLIGHEGGYVNDPADKGGATKYGVSLRFLRSEGAFDLDADGVKDFDLDMDGDIDSADVRKLSLDDAKALYHRCFWTALDCDALPAPLGEMLFDQAVNGGRSAAVKMLQSAINLPRGSVEVDGVLGLKTRAKVEAMVAAHGMAWLVTSYRYAVGHRYRMIVRRDPTQQRFLKGWLRRADDLGRL